ncbi:MAG: hypothetical protein AB2689_02065 [Candidatus Thiodiazotropha taylori]
MSNLDEVAKAILEMEARKEENNRELEALNYDGILGIPPKWVGEPRLHEFRHHRHRMLRDWGYSPAVAKEWLDRFDSDNSDDWFYPATYPCGRELEMDLFRDTVGFLSRLRWCASLQPEEGLRELAGERAVQGYKTWIASKQGRKDALALVLEDTYLTLLNATGNIPKNDEVLNALIETCTGEIDDVIQEVNQEYEEILWIDNRGREQKTSFSRFRNRMTRIRSDLK